MDIDIEKLNKDITILRQAHREMNRELLGICNSQITDSVTLVRAHNLLDKFEQDLDVFCEDVVSLRLKG